MLKKLRCRVFGHPIPGETGDFLTSVRLSAQPGDLPHIEVPCPCCDVALPLYFRPGSRGTNTPSHIAALLRWQASRSSGAEHVEYTVEEGSSGFRVYAMDGDRQIGVCAGEKSALFDWCYVYDLVVFKEQDRRMGVGSELVRQAWIHSGSKTVVPVDIVSDAALWWAKRAAEQTIPVRLGLSRQEKDILQYATANAAASAAQAQEHTGKEE